MDPKEILLKLIYTEGLAIEIKWNIVKKTDDYN